MADLRLILRSRTDSQSANPVMRMVPIAASQAAKLLTHSHVGQGSRFIQGLAQEMVARATPAAWRHQARDAAQAPGIRA